LLFVVATPIGNLKDITLRAIETLREASIIAAEDTRHTRKLLSAHGIEPRALVSLHAHSTKQAVNHLVDRLQAGESIALVTDAGTPGVSDPGDALVRATIAAGIRVIPIPGPSAVIAALSASGLGSGGGFRFFGFLPRDGTSRARALALVASTPEPAILYESPERAKKTLAELADLMPTREACIARELTKIHEELARGTLADLAVSRDTWRGEIVLVLGPLDIAEAEVTDAELDARIDKELERGFGSKHAAELVAAWSGRPKREVYERVVRRKKVTL
jgi:16S rRNA (cytidine1402-2'-O)-methyltransferase